MSNPVVLPPSEATKKQIYKIYEAIFNSSFPEKKKIRLINSLFMWEPWTWRVVGISTNAFHEFSNNDFKSKSGTFNRDHFIQDRQVTFKRMALEFMSHEEWWKWFWENDKTILMTKEEHLKKKSLKLSKIIKINWQSGFFSGGGMVGFRYTKEEAEFLKKLIKENNIKC